MKQTLQTLFTALAAVMLLGQAAWGAIDVKLAVVATGLNAPMMAISPPDGSGRLFIVEQSGTIRIVQGGKLLDEPFLNVASKLVPQMPFFDERGLLSLAFHPNFKSNGKFYVFYSAPVRGDAGLEQKLWYSHTQYISEMRVSSSNANKADTSYERVLMRIDWPQFNHNGGNIAFGPEDGYLYISLGDGGYANDWGIGHHVTMGNGQDLTSLHGSIIRIDIDSGDPYGIPSDNPFLDSEDAREEIYAYGFRNPWRMSFDMGGSHALFVADVQQNSYEEVDVVVKGGNYGWRIREADRCFDFVTPNGHPPACASAALIDPIVSYNHCNKHPNDCKGTSVTGGFVYRGSHGPWQGKYFFGDWSVKFGTPAGQLFAATRSGGGWSMEDINVTNMDFKGYVLGFGQDDQGDVYVATSITDGPVGHKDILYKIVP